MNLRDLEYFMIVVDCGNITSAAKNVGVSQPALSRHMKNFEIEIGQKLFNRGSRSVQLTHAGEVVYREGKLVIARVQRGMEAIRRELGSGSIRVAYAPSLANNVLDLAIESFMGMHPQARLVLSDANDREMFDGVEQGKYDLLITARYAHSQVKWRDLFEQYCRIAVPRQHKYVNRRKLKSSMLGGERFLMLNKFDYPGYWQATKDYFQQNSINAKVAGEFDGGESLMLALEAGLGLAIVAESAILKSARVVRAEPELPPVRVSVGWSNTKEPSLLMKSFVDSLVAAAVKTS